MFGMGKSNAHFYGWCYRTKIMLQVAVGDVHQAVQDFLLSRPELSGDNVTLMGVSYGGFIAATLAAKHPEKYDSLVLVDPFLNLLTYAQVDDYVHGLLGLNCTTLGQALPDEELAKLQEV